MLASEQLEEALKIFDEVSLREDVEVNNIVYFRNENGKFTVCFAGASILKNWKGEFPDRLGPANFENGDHYRGLSYLNFGHLRHGVWFLTGKEEYDLELKFEVPDCNDDRDGWRKRMGEMLTYLKERGL